MSFSREVKEELEKQIGKSRHCQLAELSALVSFCGQITDRGNGSCLELETEHAGLAKKGYTLIKKAFGFQAELFLETGCLLRISDREQMGKILEALRLCRTPGDQQPPDGRTDGILLQNSCCRRAYVRGCFLAAGSISDPQKAYHFEIVCRTVAQAQQLQELMCSFDTDAKIVERK